MGVIHGINHSPGISLVHGPVRSNAFHIAVEGQSNADLRADIDTITRQPFLELTFMGAQFTRHNAPSAADPPVFSDSSGFISLGTDSANNMGVELSMGRRLAEVLPGTVYLHFCTIAGSSVDLNRAVNAAYPSSGPNAHSLMKAHLQAVSPRIDCLVTIDGESDATAPANAANYETKKTAIYADYRATFGAGVPIVISQLADTHGYANQATIISAQANIAGAIGNCTLVSNAGRVLNGLDHYTNNSFAALGEDLADAVLTRLGYPRVRWTSTAVNRQVTFTYSGTGATPVSYAWDFGDGTTSTAQNPVKTYAANGKYVVRCTATSATGKQHSFSRARVAVDASGRWTVDATSAKARPANSTEAGNIATDGNLLIGAADHIWLCQEAAGNLADSKGAKTLTAGNSPAYQAVVAGWSTKFVDGNSTPATTESFVSATMTNVNAGRVAGLSYVNWASSGTASNRAIINRGGPGVVECTSSGATAKARIVYGAVSGITANDHAGAVQPHFLYQDPTAHRVIFASPLEVKELIFFRQTGTAYSQQTGAEYRITTQASADVAAHHQHNLGLAWDAIPQAFADSLTTTTAAGNNYDEIRCMFEALGWDCAW